MDDAPLPCLPGLPGRILVCLAPTWDISAILHGARVGIAPNGGAAWLCAARHHGGLTVNAARLRWHVIPPDTKGCCGHRAATFWLRHPAQDDFREAAVWVMDILLDWHAAAWGDEANHSLCLLPMQHLHEVRVQLRLTYGGDAGRMQRLMDELMALATVLYREAGLTGRVDSRLFPANYPLRMCSQVQLGRWPLTERCVLHPAVPCASEPASCRHAPSELTRVRQLLEWDAEVPPECTARQLLKCFSDRAHAGTEHAAIWVNGPLGTLALPGSL